MRVLVLGARGFLGGHVVAALRAAGVPVAAPPAGADLARHPPESLAALLVATGTTVVVNAAGRTAGDARELAAANDVLVNRVVTACARAGGLRLVHLGSAAEYGVTSPGVPVAEDAPARPQTPYGRTKLAGTRAVLDASAAGLVDGRVLRVFNPVGRGQPAVTLAGRVLAQVRAGGPDGTVRVGRLDAYRDFVGAACVAAAVVAAATGPSEGPAGGDPAARLLNVGSGRATSCRDLVRELLRAAGHRGRLVEAASGGPASARSAGLDSQQADVRRAAAVLGWRPAPDLGPAVLDAASDVSPVRA